MESLNELIQGAYIDKFLGSIRFKFQPRRRLRVSDNYLRLFKKVFLSRIFIAAAASYSVSAFILSVQNTELQSSVVLFSNTFIIRFYVVRTVVFNTQNHWNLGHCSSLVILIY
jgi:hypothetical protein